MLVTLVKQGLLFRCPRETFSDILKSGGSAVDAAIAALICTSVMNPQSSGLGGGVVFTIYNASKGMVEVINARETVPRVFLHNLLSGCAAGFPVGKDRDWIAVPGELRGYEAAHKRYGRLPWKALFEPTIKVLSEPLVISPVMEKFIHHPAFASLGKSLWFLKRGETFRWPALQQTLRVVAENGAAAFYEGQIGKALVEDIRRAGSSMSLEDLKAYKAEVSSALNITLNSHTTVFSPGPPMGGAVLLFILKILEGKLHEASLATPEERVETYHRIAEALKFGNIYVSLLSLQEAVGPMLSDELAQLARHRIDARGDHPLTHYNLLEPIYNHRYKSKGTSHVSVLAADGSAVSATIIASPATCQVHRVPARAVYQKCKTLGLQKPPSAMVPSILISKTGDMLVIGGAGGAWIVSATSMAIINKLWFGYDLEHAISAPIMHTEGDSILFEDHFSEEVRSGLLGRGHKEKKVKFAMNVVQGITKEGKCISAYSDKRKLGKSAGY
uniref:Gamma-glutamyltransferase 5 n=1 Tax=Amazona collaria TaxID=241587 RepID=A0A8B9G1F1_9PSIT